MARRSKGAEVRHHPNNRGPVRLMAEADGYAMVRRPGQLPFVIMAKRFRQWNEYDPKADPNA